MKYIFFFKGCVGDFGMEFTIIMLKKKLKERIKDMLNFEVYYEMLLCL